MPLPLDKVKENKQDVGNENLHQKKESTYQSLVLELSLNA